MIRERESVIELGVKLSVDCVCVCAREVVGKKGGMPSNASINPFDS